MEEDNWENLLGGLKQPPKPSNLNEIIEKMLLEPLKEDYISWSICSNCGIPQNKSYQTINKA